ncbi:MAG: hypothetical protein ABR909_04900 [Candidatus Bathyarchaeia archaeon]|jgi:hypothetical protein
MSEEELIGTLVKLRKRESELHKRVEGLGDQFNGSFGEALKKTYSDNISDPDRIFKADMSVNPDKLIALATELKAIQKEYAEAYHATREFEKAHPTIAKMYPEHF